MNTFTDQIAAARRTLDALERIAPEIEHAAALVRDALLSGRRVLTCGNGGSATDAQHLAEELIARYRSNRRALPAIALTADSAVLTCIGNDFGFDQIFSRQIEALAAPGDLVVAFSTSGNSPNIVAALHATRAAGATSIALLGRDGGAGRALADLALVVSDQDTARVQEGHLQILHYLCEVVEQALTST